MLSHVPAIINITPFAEASLRESHSIRYDLHTQAYRKHAGISCLSARGMPARPTSPTHCNLTDRAGNRIDRAFRLRGITVLTQTA